MTELRRVRGPFDFLVDWGVYDDLSLPHRRAYLRNVLPLTHAHSRFLIYVHQWTPRWWERLFFRLGFFGHMLLEPGEAERRFGTYFDIECYAQHVDYSQWPSGYAVYLMTRREIRKQ